MTTKQAVYNHIMVILELDKEAVNSLKAAKVTTLRKLINIKMDTLSLMAENDKDKFAMCLMLTRSTTSSSGTPLGRQRQLMLPT